jgi:two-component system, LytTR family, response regulator
MLNRNLIKAVIIDDEAHNRNVLRTLLTAYAQEVEVIAEAQDADDAFFKIRHLHPQLIFLDIKMPGKSGFDLLRMFEKIDFEVVFVSAFNEFAITAFEFNALDYILKPIDHAKLKKAVGKAVDRVKANKEDDDILHFIKTLDEANDLITKFSVHHNGKVMLVNVSEIAFLEANVDYVNLNLVNGSRYTSSKSLKQFEEVLHPLKNFIRVSKSILINTDSIKSYTKGEVCIIELNNGQFFEVSRRKKTEILNRLKTLID